MHAVQPAFSIEQKVARRMLIRSSDQCARDQNRTISGSDNVKNGKSIFDEYAVFNRVCAPKNRNSHFNPVLRLKFECRKHNNISLSLIDPIAMSIWSIFQASLRGPASNYSQKQKVNSCFGNYRVNTVKACMVFVRTMPSILSHLSLIYRPMSSFSGTRIFRRRSKLPLTE